MSSIKNNQQVEEILNFVRSINEKVKSSHVLNGGFENLMKNVSDLKSAQEQMQTAQDIIKDDVKSVKEELYELKTKLYDPEDGVLNRIKTLEVVEKVLTQDEKDTKKAISEIEDSIVIIGNKVDDFLSWKSNANRVLWGAAAAIGLLFLNQVWALLGKTFQ